MLRNFETSKEKAIKKDFEEKCWSLLEEKILCEKLRGYPILYDKTHKRYKEMVAVENTCNAVSDELEFIGNFRFKNRSSRRINVLQKMAFFKMLWLQITVLQKMAFFKMLWLQIPVLQRWYV